MDFFVIGISHQELPLEKRQQYALSSKDVQNILQIFSYSHSPKNGIAILATCNRLEIYTHGYTEKEALSKWFEMMRLLNNSDATPGFMKRNHDCFQHMISVSLGLKSQILKEFHILGQIKNAYRLSHDAHLLSHPLRRLFEYTLHVSKKIRSNWTTKRSLGQHVSEKLIHLDPQACFRILMIGAGMMGQDVIRHLTRYRNNPVTIANRTIDKAIKLTKSYKINIIDIEKLDDKVHEFDLIICTITGQLPPPLFEKISQNPPIIFDLSMPSLFFSRLQHEQNYYHLDHFSSSADQPLENELALHLQDLVFDFQQWVQYDCARPLIAEYRQNMDHFCNQLLESALIQSQTGGNLEEIFGKMVYQMKQKLLHVSSVALKKNLVLSKDYSSLASHHAITHTSSESTESVSTL